MNKKFIGSHCLGIVLAGGLSTRMGTNKAHLSPFNEQQSDMLAFSQNALINSGVKDIVISGDNYQVSDNYKNLGPLSGIYSVIKQYQPKAILALPVDLPLLTADTLQALKLAGELSNKACFYEKNYLPLYMPINGFSELILKQTFTSLIDDLSAQSSNNVKGPSMRKFLSQLPHQCMPLKNHQTLFNCNTPEQWQQAKQWYANTKM